jgi:diguanylate cyclase (GGDEF)-like protein
MNDSKKINIEEYIDIKTWEKIQNTLTETIKLPVCTVDLEGNEVLLTGKLPYFSEILRTTKYGLDMLRNCRIQAIKKILNEKDEVVLYHSDDGLLNILAPIKIQGKNIGAIGLISLLDANKKSIDFTEIVNNTNIDSEEIREALNKMKSLSNDEINMHSSMLRILTKTVPEIVNQKYQSDKKILELTAIYNLTKMMNSTMEIEKIIAYIIKFIVESFKVKNCSVIILEGNYIKNKFYYQKGEELKNIEDIIIPETINTKNLIKIADIDTDFRFSKIVNKSNFKSILSFPLKIKNDPIGVLNLYLDSLNALNEEKQEFISVVADQLAMAAYNAREFQEAKETGIVDELTNLYNRRYFVDLLKEDLIRDIESKEPLSIVMLDIDDFKHYNDTNGHVKGDNLLKDIGEILKNEVRRVDIVGRYGGEEFIIIFPEMNNDIALSVVERIRKKVEDTEFFGRENQPNRKVTISAGLVTCMDKSILYEELIEFVDKALYKSKVNGKNMITSMVIVDKNLPRIDVQEVNKHHSINQN